MIDETYGKKFFCWRENMIDTIQLNKYVRTWIISFTTRIAITEKRAWPHDYISESIDRKENDFLLNEKNMIRFVSSIALLKI